MALEIKKFKDRFVDLIFEQGFIYGIYGKGSSSIFSLLTSNLNNDNQIFFQERKLEFYSNKKRNTIISYASLKDVYFYTKTVQSEFKFLKEYCDVSFEKERIVEVLIQVGLDKSYMIREIDSLSYTEKLQVYLALHLIVPFEIFILEDIYSMFDLKIRKKIDLILNELKMQGKIVLFSIQDVNILYSMTDYICFLTEDKLVGFGKTEEMFTKVEFLQRNHIDVPYLSLIPYLAKERKDVKLFYRTDVRDTIKDIYKHV